MRLKGKVKKYYIILISVLFFCLLIIVSSGPVLSMLGHLLILDDPPKPADAVVVLKTGIDYYPRLIEAGQLYQKGLVQKVVINGNRNSDVLRKLRKMGFQDCCTWYEDYLRILALFNVPRDRVMTVSAEDVYDTVSESMVVGNELIKQNVQRIIITTSKFHTRRAKFIWKKSFPNQFSIIMISAKSDPFNPDDWWKHGRQIRWVLAEYGAWFYYCWKHLIK